MKEIKILHLSYSDNYGGASVAMKRIHQAISSQKGISSTIATVTKPADENAICLYNSLFDRIWLYLCVRIAYKLVNLLQRNSNNSGRSINFFPSTVLRQLKKHDYDILHLHWIGNETIRLEYLERIEKPIVWTFHDTWPLLGAEYTDVTKSSRFESGYTKNNRPESLKGLDIDRWVWCRKRKVFNKLKIHPIAISNWMKIQISKSLLWKSSDPVLIHNPIDVDIWKILDKKGSRCINKLTDDCRVVLFGAVNGFKDKLKGYKLLEAAMLVVANHSLDKKYVLLVFGDPVTKEVQLSRNLLVKSIGKITDQEKLNLIYCSADVTVVPSYQETFGQVAVESAACGVPVVAFNTSGLRDIVIEELNGFLAKPYESADLAQKINVSLNYNWSPQIIRDDIRRRFGMEDIGSKYLKKYLSMI